MGLELNEPPVRYNEFFGRYQEQMPQLITAGRSPMTVADLMRRRLEVAGSNDPTLRSAWLDNYFDTSDAIVYHPSGKVKIVPDAPSLRECCAESELTDGALRIDDAVYRSLAGLECRRDAIVASMNLTKREVWESPVWQTLAGDNEYLLRAYTDFVFAEAHQRFDAIKNMAVYPRLPQPRPCMRAWIVYGVYDGSGLNGASGLYDQESRLVGLLRTRAPE